MIEVEDLVFAYPGGTFALRVPRLDVGEGERVALVGPSGSGKTTLIHLIAGILVPHSGRLRFAGLDVATLGLEDRQDVRAAKIGLVFQEFELLEHLDVLDNVLLPYRISPVLALDDTVRQRAKDLLEDVGLGDALHRKPRHLSQGERQRTAVCRALVTEPALLLGDEPTGNLDEANRDHVMDILFAYASRTGAPLIVVTHDRDLEQRFEQVLDLAGMAS